MMACRRPFVGLALAALLLAVPGARSQAAEVVARVGKTEVTIDQLRTYLDSLDPRDRAALSRDPAALSQVVRSFLARQAVLQEARARKWDEQPAVKAQLDRVRDEALTDLYLARISQSPDGYPSASEIQQAYDANRAAFEVPKGYRLAQIFVAAPKGDAAAEEKGRKRVEDIARKLRAKGADFAAAARAESEDRESAPRGGEIGWLSEGQMVPGIRNVATELAKGWVSEPVRLDDGFHLVKLLDVRPAAVRPLAEVREAIAAELRAERAKQNRQAYLAKLLDQNPPALNELALSKLLPADRAKGDLE
jgi:peptidylprolyl isomerase